jgi:hypothetical protein
MTKEWSAQITTAKQTAVMHLAKELAKEMELVLMRYTRTCINCEHFELKTELCRLAAKRPTATIIATGCEQHEEAIPF